MSLPFSQIRTTLLLALLFSFRLLGLFMILPVFSLYASSYQGNTLFLMGVAIGIYGLTQALFQLPFGFLSDRFGRKPLIVIGFLLFAIGSLIAGFTQHIYGLILGRALQGSGAIGSTLLAMTADLTSEKYRTQAMAIIGISIGASFSIAIMLGPWLAASHSISSIFFLSFIFALLGIILTFLLPSPHIQHPLGFLKKKYFKFLFEKKILAFNMSILCLHFILTANFIVIPILLLKQFHIEKSNQYLFYLPLLVFSAISMMIILRKSEKNSKNLRLFKITVAFLCLSQAGLTFLNFSFLFLFIHLFLFFTALNLLEAILPSLLSMYAPAEGRGTALGFYSTCQFIGIFLGGILGGYTYGQFSLMGVFLLGFIVNIFWLLSILKINK